MDKLPSLSNNSGPTKPTTTTRTTYTLKDAYKYGCFSKEKFPWLTLDQGDQPKKIQQAITGISVDNEGYSFNVDEEVIQGKSSTGIVLFKKTSDTGGYYVGLTSKKKFPWSCTEPLEILNNQDKFVTDFIEKNNDYTGDTPSNYLINRVWKPVDVSTLDRSGLFKPGDRIIYQKMGTLNTRIDQYPHIEAALSGAGYTLIEPPITTPEHDKGIDISRIMGGKYRNYFEELRKQGDSTIVWPKGNYLDYNKKASELSGVTTGVTPELVRDPKKVLELSNKGGLAKSDCRKYIKALYKISQSQKEMNDDQLMTIKNFVYGCYRQNTKFKFGAFGVGDELNKLVTNTSKYGIADLVRGTGEMNESIILKNIVKETLIKKSNEKTTQLLSENTIIKNRYNVLNEGVKPKNKKELSKLFDSILTETAYLHNQDFNKELIKEGFFDLLQGIFGKASTSVFQYFKEHVASWLLKKFLPGVSSNSWLGNLIVTSVGNLPLTELHNLTNCSFVTKMLSKDIVEASINKIKNEQGLTGPGYDILRNALVEMAEDSAFGQKVENKISEFICPKLQGLKDKLDSQGLNMKTNALGLKDNNSKISSIGDKVKSSVSGIGDKVKSLVSK